MLRCFFIRKSMVNTGETVITPAARRLLRFPNVHNNGGHNNLPLSYVKHVHKGLMKRNMTLLFYYEYAQQISRYFYFTYEGCLRGNFVLYTHSENRLPLKERALFKRSLPWLLCPLISPGRPLTRRAIAPSLTWKDICFCFANIKVAFLPFKGDAATGVTWQCYVRVLFISDICGKRYSKGSNANQRGETDRLFLASTSEEMMTKIISC